MDAAVAAAVAGVVAVAAVVRARKARQAKSFRKRRTGPRRPRNWAPRKRLKINLQGLTRPGRAGGAAAEGADARMRRM